MKFLIPAYHFLGGAVFAIILITVTAVGVIAGTIIESKTGSHHFAAAWTYGNNWFILLLWLFFLNILFATLRRWPFRKHHIPFIITHLGLLMLLGGCLVKSYFGIQGHMLLVKGSDNNLLILTDSVALNSESQDKLLNSSWVSDRARQTALWMALVLCNKNLDGNFDAKEMESFILLIYNVVELLPPLSASHFTPRQHAAALLTLSRLYDANLTYQPHTLQLPYQLHLEEAMILHYPETSQPCHFEADMLVADDRTGSVMKTTVTMNNVLEMWDGYRFYLSEITKARNGSPDSITLIVNRDPAKYFLTYPGAIILTLGILLLFWKRP